MDREFESVYPLGKLFQNIANFQLCFTFEQCDLVVTDAKLENMETNDELMG